ncbi:MAG: colanic acid biosynthesis glycosyltransferase WcaI [Deltaproteobacteria bacterium]|nr:colanic acid biosynthesis glycosyltransferase WcaI [Deltaproteobacteria bacterium]
MALRILIHGINYAPEFVGIGRYTGELGAWLHERGHAVTVLAAPPYYPVWRVPAAYRRPAWRREWLEGVEVLRAPLYAPARVTGKGRVLHELSFGASCLAWWPTLWARSWDVVLAVCPLLQSGLVPALLARHQKVPFIFHVQDLQLDAARELGIIQQPLLFALLSRLEHFLFTRSQAVTTISRAMAARIQEKGAPPERVHLLPNWADLEAIKPGERRNAVRRELGLNAEIMVLYAGSMGEKQGLEIILDAAAITRDNQAIRYVFVGEGAAREQLMDRAQRLALETVSFWPVQSRDRFPLLLQAADIHLVVQKDKASDLVMPSKLGNILSAGRPFIATARPETELGRVATESQAGLLTPPEAAGSLAQAVVHLAQDEEARRKMGLRARQFAEAWLGREKIMAEWERLFYGLVNQGDRDRI